MAAHVVPCTGPGVGVDDFGQVTVRGPRTEAWPADCTLAQSNGARFDTDGSLWVSPDCDVRYEASQPSVRSYDPTKVGSRLLGEFTYSVTTRQCMKTEVDLSLQDGFTSAFMSPGNYWVVRRQNVVKLNDEETHSSERTLFFMSPGATMWIGVPHPDFQVTRIVDPLTKVSATFRYYLDVLSFDNAALNHVDTRFANVNITTRSFPL